MRRVRRILLNIATVVTALGCVAAAVDWSLSHGRFWAAYRAWGSDGDVVGLSSHDGALYGFHARPGGRPTGWTFDRDDNLPSSASVERLAGLTVRRWQPVRWFSYRGADREGQMAAPPMVMPNTH